MWNGDYGDFGERDQNLGHHFLKIILFIEKGVGWGGNLV